jgi:hypothetical protein
MLEEREKKEKFFYIKIRVKYLIGTRVLDFFKFSGKNPFGTSIRFSVQILMACHVSTSEVDTWHYIYIYIKKIFKIFYKYNKINK